MEALQLAKSRPDLSEDVGNVHYFSGEFQEALQYFQKSNQSILQSFQTSKSETSLQNVLQNELKQGVCSMNLGLYDQAEQLFLKAIELIQEHSSLLPPQQSSSPSEDEEIQQQQEQNQSSSYLFESDFLYKLAQLYLIKSENSYHFQNKYERMEAEKLIRHLLEKSMNYFQKSIELSSSTNVDAHFGVGICLQRLGKVQEAQQQFENIVNKIDKTFYAACLSLADIYYFQKNYDHAAAYYKEFVEHYKEFCMQIAQQGDRAINRETIYYEALFKMGLAHIQLKDYTMSIILLDKLLDVEDLPKQWRALAHNKRGLCYLKLGEYNKCIADQTAAIHLSDKYIDAFRDRAIAFEMIGKYEEAAQDNRQREFLTRAKFVETNK